MPLWGKNDAVSNAMLYIASQYDNTANDVAAMYTNAAITTDEGGRSVGLFCVDATEVVPGASQGWVMRTEGTGYVTNVGISDGGTGYTNGDIYRISSITGGTNATATIGTNSTGGIITLTLTNSGRFINGSPTVAATNSTGGSTNTSATLTYSLGGRAGRKQYETLVALTNVTGANTAIT